MKKPVIGIIDLYDETKQNYWMLPCYVTAIKKAGGIAIILPYSFDSEELAEIPEHLDGVLFTGGHDINPIYYNEERLPECGESLPFRDLFEVKLMQEILKKDIPALCICRGMQLLNIVSGGSLYQDLPTEYESDINHRMEKPYDAKWHDVKLGGALKELLAKETLGVNSRHHQGVKELGDHLEVMATSTDHLIEGIRRTDKKFVWGVQWHPEHSYKADENSLKIFEEFISNAK